MSFALFQPLLHDPLGWKASNTTYADTFKPRSYDVPSKEKKSSPYGQQYQKQMRKQQQLMKLRPINAYLLQPTYEEQSPPRFIVVERNDKNREVPAESYQFSRSKTLPVLVEETSAYGAEQKNRSTSNYKEAIQRSRATQCSPSVARATSVEGQQYSKDGREKSNGDGYDDPRRHWLTYPNPQTPPFIVDIKQRLGQTKTPSILTRSTSVLNTSGERQHPSSRSNDHLNSSFSHQSRKQASDKRHLLDCDLPETPPELRAARHRLEKHRYHPTLDNYPPRPQTNLEETEDYSRPSSPPAAAAAPQSEDEQSPANDNNTLVTEEENKTTDNESPLVVVQMLDADGLPIEYIEAVEISNAAQEEYYKNPKTPGEKRSDQSIYRIPPENKLESTRAYHNQQQQPSSDNKDSARLNEFNHWLRKSSDKERESAAKILNEVLYQPVIGYGTPKKRPVAFKQAPAPVNRTNSVSRQLGHTRNHQRIPCEICEKQLIKHHIWSLSRSNSLSCAHQD